jgi:hypothetical protein
MDILRSSALEFGNITENVNNGYDASRRSCNCLRSIGDHVPPNANGRTGDQVGNPRSNFGEAKFIGRGGRRFQMLKFRTSVHSPEHLVTPWAEEITRVGRFLRFTRLEALPQLINVLRGEMSIIDSSAHSPSFLD